MQTTVLRKRSLKGAHCATKSGQHRRVDSARGKPYHHTCPCGRVAEQWANLTDNYSDVYDYEAMCRRCHYQYDADRLKAFANNPHPYSEYTGYSAGNKPKPYKKYSEDGRRSQCII